MTALQNFTNEIIQYNCVQSYQRLNPCGAACTGGVLLVDGGATLPINLFGLGPFLVTCPSVIITVTTVRRTAHLDARGAEGSMA